MRGQTAKILRAKLAYHPADKREYDNPLTPVEKFLFTSSQQTVRCTSARGQYQRVKRNKALRAVVLGGV